jgi:hypothetical protein
MSQEKRYLGAIPMVNHKEYYKKEGGGFPQIWAMVNLVRPCMFVVHLCTKHVLTTH